MKNSFESPKRSVDETFDQPTTPTKKPKTGEQFSPDTYLSAPSPSRVSSSSIGDVVIGHNIDEEGNILFTISPERVSTVLPKGRQGNHVTPYGIFLRMLCNSVKSKDVNKIKSKLEMLFEAVLPDDIENFKKEITQSFSKKIEQTISHQQRKKATAQFRDLGMDEKEVQKHKYTLLVGQTNPVAEMVVFLSTQFLKKLNAQEDMCFAQCDDINDVSIEDQASASNTVGSPLDMDSAERSKAKSGHEGSRVKDAMYSLISLDRVSLINSFKNTEDKDEFYENLTEQRSELLYGIRRIFKITYKDKHELNEFVNNLKILHKSKDSNAAAIFNCENDIISLINQKISESKFYNTVGKLVNDLFDFNTTDHTKDTNVEDTLYKVCARHLVIIFNTFDSLNKDQSIKDEIIDGFLEDVLEKQGWKDFKKDGKNLDLKELKKGIDGFADLVSMKMKDKSHFQQHIFPVLARPIVSLVESPIPLQKQDFLEKTK